MGINTGSFYFADRPRGCGRTQKIGMVNSGHFTPKMRTALAYEYAKVRIAVYYGGPKEHTFAKEVAYMLLYPRHINEHASHLYMHVYIIHGNSQSS